MNPYKPKQKNRIFFYIKNRIRHNRDEQLYGCSLSGLKIKKNGGEKSIWKTFGTADL